MTDVRIAIAYDCKWCHQDLSWDGKVWVDDTGGDVCGVHSVAEGVPPNTNQPHEVEGF